MQLSPLSTLESSFEALNVKKFDGDCTFSFTYLSSRTPRSKILTIFFLYFQLHLQWIRYTIRHLHNLMKAEQRDYYWITLVSLGSVQYCLTPWKYQGSALHVMCNKISQRQLIFLSLKVSFFGNILISLLESHKLSCIYVFFGVTPILHSFCRTCWADGIKHANEGWNLTDAQHNSKSIWWR